VSTAETGESRSSQPPRERWPFRWWWIPAYFAASIFFDMVGEAVWNRLITIGGYGLTNSVAGLLAAAVCFVIYSRTRVRHRKLEVEGDPERLPVTTDYVTMATPTVVLGWMAGVVTWGVALLLLAVAGFGSAWVLGPIIGTAFILGARMEAAHARTMDARRGMPPSTGHG
jgi:hypothetical protein